MKRTITYHQALALIDLGTNWQKAQANLISNIFGLVKTPEEVLKDAKALRKLQAYQAHNVSAEAARYPGNQTEKNPFDYRSILVRYIHDVGIAEGVDFGPDHEIEHWTCEQSHPEYTHEEALEFRKLAEEADDL